jgi:hypothetical protein
MDQFLLRRMVLVTIVVLLLLIPCLLYNIGVDREFNKNAKVVECNIINSNKNITCCEYTCSKLCYNIYIIVNYSNVVKTLILYDKIYNTNYSIPTNISCYYYNKDIQLLLTDDKSYYIAYIFFTSLACVIFLTWFALEIYHTRHKLNIIYLY